MSNLRLKNQKIITRYFRGVSLVETLLVVAIMGIIFASAYPLGSGFLTRNAFKSEVNELTNTLRVAHLNSISGKEASNWGVYVTENQITLFKGSSYATRDLVYDETFEISSSVFVNPVPSEIYFHRLTGNPSQTITLSLTNSIGESTSVSVNEVGVVDVN